MLPLFGDKNKEALTGRKYFWRRIITVRLSSNTIILAKFFDLTRPGPPNGWWFSKGPMGPRLFQGSQIDRLVKYYEPFGQIGSHPKVGYYIVQFKTGLCLVMSKRAAWMTIFPILNWRAKGRNWLGVVRTAQHWKKRCFFFLTQK